MNVRSHLTALLLLFPIVASAQFRFSDFTDSAKIDQKSDGTQNVGPGVIVLDFNNDGWDDLYLPGGFYTDKLYLNLHDGTFIDVADTVFNKHNNFFVNSRAATAFDYDNDGLTDIYVCSQGNDLLWKNNGDGTFKSVGQAAGLTYSLDQNQSNCASFGDFDGDGDNDFYVARWINEVKFIENPDPKIVGYAHKGFPNWLYVNNGNGTFTERAKEFGVDGDTGSSNIVLLFDYDRDGDLDLLVGNDFGVELMPNRVWKNMLMETGQAAFVRVDSAIGLEQHIFCMAISPNDYDRDGDFDLYETSIGPQRLMQNNNNIFTDAGVEANIPDGYLPPPNDTMTTTWTALFSDFDNDGWEDAFIVHGYIPAIAPWATTKSDTSEFLWNRGGVFENYTDSSGVLITIKGKGAVLLDYDHDGKVDFVEGSLRNAGGGVSSKNFRLYRNVTPDAHNGHWLQMKFTATRTAKEGIGTIADVWTNGIVHSKQISTGGGQGSCNSLTAFIGLGPYAKADSIIVYWPADKYRNRSVNRYYNVSADRIIHYTEDSTKADVSLIVNNFLNNTISVYPSPAYKTLTVDYPAVMHEHHIEIFDMLGIKQLNFTLSDPKTPLAIEKLKPGCYTLRLTSNGHTTTKQFIKE